MDGNLPASDPQSHEPELPPLVCPRCATEVDHEPWPPACPKCQHPFDLDAQFAYCRGHNAFTVGQELIMANLRLKRKSRLPGQGEKEGMAYYMQAYTALQQAFHGELAGSQRQLAIRMMAAIAQLFQRYVMISPLEAEYWSTLLVEMNSRQELVDLRAKLAGPHAWGVLAFPLRLRWRLRIRQLDQGIKTLEQKVLYLEKTLRLAENLHTHPEYR